MPTADVNLPMGLCPDCLDRLIKDDNYPCLIGNDGTILMDAYCPHREAGAMGTMQPGKPLVWKIIIPIDAIAWKHGLDVRRAALGIGIAEVKTDGNAAPDVKH